MNKTPIISTGVLTVLLAGTGIVPLTVLAATINGTNGNDIMEGTDNPDTIYGNAGNDKIYGYKWDDILYGGTGDDRIWGGSHNDRIYAWHGDNVVSGGEGNDRIWATGGPDDLGSEGDYNTLRGYGDDDSFIVRMAGATIYGGSGDDILESRSELAANNMYGGDGADEFRCNGGFNSAEDFDESEGDTITGECESINS